MGEASGSSDFGSRGGRYRDHEDAEMEEFKPQIKVEVEDDDLERVLAKARKLKQRRISSRSLCPSTSKVYSGR